MAYEKLTVNVQECCEIMSNAGIPIGCDKLRIGIQRDAFPEFSRCIDMRTEDGRGNCEYMIFKRDLLDFIKSHGGYIQEHEK